MYIGDRIVLSSYKLINITIKVRTPIIVVNIPVFLDLVQPERAIKTERAMIPNIKVIKPMIFGSARSAFSTLKGKPLVVINRILVMANKVIKKQAAATVVTFKI